MLRRLALAAALAACTDDSAPCPDFVGDSNAGVELELSTLNPSGTAAPLADGARVRLVLPPQGGRVVFAGVRAKNICAGAVQVTASLRDDCTGRIIGLEGRPIVLARDADGWAAAPAPSELSSYANIAVCPNHVAARDLYDTPYRLELTLKDRLGRSATKNLSVTPGCDTASEAEECRCLCQRDYVLGQSCHTTPDAGGGGGACPAG